MLLKRLTLPTRKMEPAHIRQLYSNRGMAESRNNGERHRLSDTIGGWVFDKDCNPKTPMSMYERERYELHKKADKNLEDFELYRAYVEKQAEYRRKGLLS